MWFTNLALIEQITFIVAIIGSAFLLFKIILLIIGISDITDIMFGLGRGVIVIIFQGFICLLAIGGWVTFATSRAGLSWWESLLIGLGASIVGMAIIMLLYRAATKLEADGTLKMQNGVGKTAEVYLFIPPKSEGNGKISLSLQGRIVEANAITKEADAIKTGETVKIIAYENNIYVVEKI